MLSVIHEDGTSQPLATYTSTFKVGDKVFVQTSRDGSTGFEATVTDPNLGEGYLGVVDADGIKSASCFKFTHKLS